MTSQNARLNQASQVNDQLRTLCLKFAIEACPGENQDHAKTIARAQAYYDFLKVNPTSLALVGAGDVPGVA